MFVTLAATVFVGVSHAVHNGVHGLAVGSPAGILWCTHTPS